MGVPVTVDSDDLQALLFTNAAIKSIEHALKAQKEDPLFEQAAPRFTAASDNIARAWRDATRRRDMPELFRNPTQAELRDLSDAFLDEHEIGLLGRYKSKVEWNPLHSRELVSMGLVELGNSRERIIWADGQTTHGPNPPRVFARLTQRGVDALRGYDPRPLTGLAP